MSSGSASQRETGSIDCLNCRTASPRTTRSDASLRPLDVRAVSGDGGLRRECRQSIRAGQRPVCRPGWGHARGRQRPAELGQMMKYDEACAILGVPWMLQITPYTMRGGSASSEYTPTGIKDASLNERAKALRGVVEALRKDQAPVDERRAACHHRPSPESLRHQRRVDGAEGLDCDNNGACRRRYSGLASMVGQRPAVKPRG